MIGSVIALQGKEPSPAIIAAAVIVAPGAGVVIADSLAVSENGLYDVELTAGISGAAAAGKHIVFERRDAANAATLHNLGLCPAGASFAASLGRVSLAAGERIRALNGILGAAGETFQAMIRLIRVV